MDHIKSNNSFNLFEKTDVGDTVNEVIEIPIENLIHYENHPFRLYVGERFNDMVDSIRTNGIYSPLIVRPKGNIFEILSGHNRYEASKSLGFDTVPCIVKNDLTEDEASLIVTESNLIQRSFADLSHSERALVISNHHEAIKNQGKRTDLIEDIENMVGNDKIMTGAYEETSERYGLSTRSIARYIRLNHLIDELKVRLDSKKLGIRAGVSLSYLSDEEQEILLGYITEKDINVNMKNASQLKELSENGEYTRENVENIFLEKEKKKETKTTIKIKMSDIANFFDEDEPEESIEYTIIEALEYFFDHKDKRNKQFNNDINIVD